jgi:hypothetical protein
MTRRLLALLDHALALAQRAEDAHLAARARSIRDQAASLIHDLHQQKRPAA